MLFKFNSSGNLVWVRFRRHKLALFGLGIITISILIAGAGYLLLPDNSPNANQTFPALQKKPPGFQVKTIRVRSNRESRNNTFFDSWLFGVNPSFIEIPVEQAKAFKNGLLVQPISRVKNTEESQFFRFFELIPEKSIFTNMGAAADLADEKYSAGTFLHNRTFWLGTDKAGRDVLSRLLLGTRVSMSIGLLAVILSVTIGTLAGMVAGYFGGITDKLILWVMTVLWSIPGIILVISISLALQQKGVLVLFIAIGLTTWVEVARLVRGELLSLKQKTFVEAAIALGIPRFRILFSHLLPNLLGPIIVVATANFASAILMEAGLSFLGLGVQPPAPSWGIMVSEGFQLLGNPSSWYLVLWPSLCICILVIAFNLVGNGLRDAFDPRTVISK